MNYRLIHAFLILLVCLSPATGQDNTGGSFSDAGVGTRAQGMGDAFVALADDVYAITANPAGLATMDRASISFEYADLFGLGLAKQSWLGASFPTQWGTHAVHYRGLRFAFDPFPQTANEVTLGYSYARSWGPVAVGTTIKYYDLSSDFDQGTASGFGLDLGARYQFATRWSVGASIQNLYSTLKYGTGTTEDVGMTWRLGVAYRISDRWSASTEYAGVSGDPFSRFKAGTEYWIMRPTVRPRVAERRPESRTIFDREEQERPTYPFGLAVRAGFEKQQSGAAEFLPSVGTSIGYGSVRFDYAYLFGSKNLGSTHRYGLTYDFRPWTMPEDEPPADVAPEARREPTQPTQPTRTAPVSARRVAVLDFANGTGRADLNWLEAGFADIVAQRLSRDGADLVPRRRLGGTSTLSGPDFLAIASREGASFVVRSLFVNTAEGRTVINARLVDVATGSTIENIEVEGAQEQIFSLGNALADRIAEVVKKRLR